MPDDADALVGINPEEVRLVHDIASLIKIDDAFGEVYYTIQGAVTTFENLHAGGAPGHKIVATEPTIINTPFVLHQVEGLPDMIVGAIKHRGPISYFYGVYADKVKEFKPPSKSVDFHEEQMWSTMKTNQATVRTISNLENTESAAGA